MPNESQDINYSFEDIQRYLQGKMNAREMHEMERAALQDPFLADAIEGYSKISSQTSRKDLNELNAELQKPSSSKVVSISKMPSNRMIAASVLLLVGLGLITVILLNRNVSTKEKALSARAPTLKADSVKAFHEEVSKDSSNNLSVTELSTAKVNNEKVQPTAEKLNANKEPDEAASLLASQNSVKEENSLAAGVATKMAFSAQASEKDLITGRIINKDSLPVVNAEIKMNSDSSILTDKNGYFTINANDSVVSTNISAMGYKTTSAELAKGRYNNIVLKDRPFLLSQVPVTYLNSKKKTGAVKDSVGSMPEGGWQSFQEYVYKKLHKNYDTTSYADDEGELELEFSISEKGDPYNFKILRSTNDALTSKTIDAIREGPKWISGNAAKTSRIKVHY